MVCFIVTHQDYKHKLPLIFFLFVRYIYIWFSMDAFACTHTHTHTHTQCPLHHISFFFYGLCVMCCFKVKRIEILEVMRLRHIIESLIPTHTRTHTKHHQKTITLPCVVRFFIFSPNSKPVALGNNPICQVLLFLPTIIKSF